MHLQNLISDVKPRFRSVRVQNKQIKHTKKKKKEEICQCIRRDENVTAVCTCRRMNNSVPSLERTSEKRLTSYNSTVWCLPNMQIVLHFTTLEKLPLYAYFDSRSILLKRGSIVHLLFIYNQILTISDRAKTALHPLCYACICLRSVRRTFYFFTE